MRFLHPFRCLPISLTMFQCLYDGCRWNQCCKINEHFLIESNLSPTSHRYHTITGIIAVTDIANAAIVGFDAVTTYSRHVTHDILAHAPRVSVSFFQFEFEHTEKNNERRKTISMQQGKKSTER